MTLHEKMGALVGFLLICTLGGTRAGLAQAQTATASLTLAGDGVAIDAGAFGHFTLSYPELGVGKSDPIKPVSCALADGKAELTYAGDTKVEVSAAPDGTLSYAFSNPPAGLATYRMSMLIDFRFNQGGKWQTGSASAVAFPAEKPPHPHLFQGHASAFTLTDFEGRSLAFQIPDYSYEEVNDNREWNWNAFGWMFVAPFDKNNPRGAVTVRLNTDGAKPVVVVDQFGQDAIQKFPGKVTSEAELKADAAHEDAYYASLHPAPRDTYGGLPGSGAKLGLTRTGFFHVQKKGTAKKPQWFLVDPAGNADFHLGVCGFQPGDDYTYVKDRQQIYAWLPPYDSEYKPAYSDQPYWSRDVFSFYVANQIRKYGHYDPEALQARMIHRVRSAGFNAVGAFSGVSQADRAAKFPWVDILPLSPDALGGRIDGLRGLFDPFKPEVAQKMDAAFAGSVAASGREPLLIGYFLDNEQAFEDIPRVIPGLKGDQPAKAELVRELRAKYPDIAAFNTAWGLQAASFDALGDMALPVTTKAAGADMDAYTGAFIEAYYRLIHDTFRKYDTVHMLLGNRWQPVTANSEQLCRIAGKYCDMLSVNYYTYGVDKTFLKRLYEWSGERPFLLSEFYWASPAESGLPGGSAVRTQRERGLAYRNYVDQAASTGFVAGIEWFILIDQARTGRWFQKYEGEQANTGLFSVTDRPYKDFLAEASTANAGIYDVLLGRRPPFAWDDPRFVSGGVGRKTVSIPHAIGPMALNGRREEWPGTPPELVPSSRMVIGADATGFDGSYRLCWDSSNLYVHVQVSDPTPMRNNQQGEGIWNGDGVELFVGPEDLNHDGPPLLTDRHVLISAGHPADGQSAYVVHSAAQTPCRVVVTPTVDGHGYVVEAAIPFQALGFTPTPGQVIRFDLAIDDGDGTGRQRQLTWNGTARDSGDRSDWGQATLVK